MLANVMTFITLIPGVIPLCWCFKTRKIPIQAALTHVVPMSIRDYALLLITTRYGGA